MSFLRKHRVSLFLTLALLVSMAGHIYLGKKALFYYTSLNALRLDPFEQDFYEWVDVPSSEKIRVVMVGDSRALTWPSVVHPSIEQYNRGIHGQTSIQIRNRFQRHVAPLHPDIIVFQLGINDFKTIGLFPNKKEQILADCIQNLDALIEESLSLNAKVILTTTIPAGPISLVRKAIWSEETQEAVMQFNHYLHRINRTDVFVLDSMGILQDSHGTIPSDLYIDELHLHRAAYTKLNQKLHDMIIEIIPTTID